MDLMTVPELATELKIPEKQIYPLADRMPGDVKIHVGRRLRFLRGPLENWLRSGGAVTR
jgi:hypothetical protein